MRHVFLDTNVFVGKNFGFKWETLDSLQTYSLKGFVQIYITDIVYHEVKNRINNNIIEAKSALKAFKKKAKILNNIPAAHRLIKELDKETNEASGENMLELFDKYIKEAKIEIISTDKVSVEEVFKLYFERQAPFGSGKKKSEFPDAFSLVGLNNYILNKGLTMHVISSDRDYQNFCAEKSYYIMVESLDTLIKEISEEEYEEALTALLDYTHDNHEDIILEKVQDYLADETYFIEDDGDVSEIIINSLEIIDKDTAYTVLEVTETEIIAEVSLTIKIDLTGKISIIDHDSSFWDSEEKEYLFKEYMASNISSEAEIKVSLSLEVNYHTDEAVYNVLTINEGNGIWI
ncbi:PIN domain-containing protein [Shouchella hunanensis]|uniref:PIN domain-containing protein n=1 Tax=Shouchella hunanensis TaxID=766894 RepID=A0ABY7WB91_9BACI|nr:PIN domain-containing protein [Shouchella hunanensis]WDF05946.1 PIN domain-containing protein [Shouchella hunanensis]